MKDDIKEINRIEDQFNTRFVVCFWFSFFIPVLLSSFYITIVRSLTMNRNSVRFINYGHHGLEWAMGFHSGELTRSMINISVLVTAISMVLLVILVYLISIPFRNQMHEKVERILSDYTVGWCIGEYQNAQQQCVNAFANYNKMMDEGQFNYNAFDKAKSAAFDSLKRYQEKVNVIKEIASRKQFKINWNEANLPEFIKLLAVSNGHVLSSKLTDIQGQIENDSNEH